MGSETISVRETSSAGETSSVVVEEVTPSWWHKIWATLSKVPKRIRHGALAPVTHVRSPTTSVRRRRSSAERSSSEEIIVVDSGRDRTRTRVPTKPVHRRSSVRSRRRGSVRSRRSSVRSRRRSSVRSRRRSSDRRWSSVRRGSPVGNRSWWLHWLKILHGLPRIWTALGWLPNRLHHGIYLGFHHVVLILIAASWLLLCE
jgi:hypothetical protein